MKPLSPTLYSRRNKKKVLVSLNAVMLAVTFLYFLYGFTQSIVELEKRNSLLFFNVASSVKSYGKPIDDSIINKIKNDENTDRIIPTVFNYGVRFSIPGAEDRDSTYPIRQSDMSYFMDKLGIKLIEGELPTDDKDEIAVNKNIAKNRGLKIGDKVGDGVFKFDGIPGEYTVTGILDSDSLTSVISANDKIFPNYKDDSKCLKNSFIVFGKDGKQSLINKVIEGLSKNDVDYNTKKTAQKNFDNGMASMGVLDIISILSIVVMVITVGSSKYVQYINRKEELGLLNAVGYNKKSILNRIFKEVFATNLIGFVLGIILGVLFLYLTGKFMWEQKGAPYFIFTVKGLIVSVFVPLFTILFSVIPINNLINKLDPIKMIEKN